MPDGKPNCLAGLTFVFTGELPSFSREEAQDAAKRYGGCVSHITASALTNIPQRRVTGQPSRKTDYVVVGDNAGPKKLETIRSLGLKSLDEAGFLNMIATRDGVLDEATIAKMKKAEEQIKKDAKDMEARERQMAKDSQTGGAKK